MFGWFRATCPVDPAAKEWIEERLQSSAWRTVCDESNSPIPSAL